MRISYLRISFLTCWFQGITSRHAKFLQGQIETLVIGHGEAARLVWVLKLDVGAAGFVNLKSSPLQGTEFLSA